jgi:hypothetical protein
MFQNITLHFVSWLGAFRFISTFLLGGMIFYLVSEKFSFRFFIVVYYISVISLVFFIVRNLLNIHLPGVPYGTESTTYIIYTFVEKHHFRNCGMFWEPGAFAGILTLCLALNAKDLPTLWRNHRFKCFTVVMALLTTKSTTGYLVLFAIIIYFLVFFLKNKLVKFFLVPALLLIGIFVYESTDFLKEKIEAQSEKSSNLVRGEFSNSRFGSFKLDLPYIKKHPFIGNGLNPVTRYADDPFLMQQMKSGDSLGNANGFSNFLACLGIPFMFFYFLLIFLQISKADVGIAFLVIFVILLTLWGEQWLYYPLFTGIMFVKVKNMKTRQRYYTPKYIPKPRNKSFAS